MDAIYKKGSKDLSLAGSRGSARGVPPGPVNRALVIAIAVWLFAGFCVPFAHAAAPADIDQYVRQAMDAFGAPGLALCIVQDGKTALAKGYGVRALNTQNAVDGHTAFPIGSETKAFTAAALAILVDRKKLSWDDRVVDRLPGFQMYDPYATAHMTIRDLLTHRSGLSLGEGDLLVIPGTTRSRADIVHALRYLKPATGFRETFAYDNILYIVAGALIEAVSGQSWETFVANTIFRPVGMGDAHANYAADASNEVALHARTDGLFRGVGDQAVIPEPDGFHVVGPAGGVNASALDMARWMNVQLAHGRLPDGSRLFSAQQATEMWSPVVVVPSDAFRLPPDLAAMQPDLQSYALGWFVESYRGHVVVEHAGAVFGALAMQYLIPEKQAGISVTINSEDSFTRRAVMFHLLDDMLGLPPTDWIGKLQKARAKLIATATAALKSLPQPAPLAGAGMDLPLHNYVGVYGDPWYGTMSVTEQPSGQLSIRFDRTPGMQGALDPVGRNRFRTRWSDRNIEDAYLDFDVVDGKIRGVATHAVSPLADFSFDFQDLHFVPTSMQSNP